MKRLSSLTLLVILLTAPLWAQQPAPASPATAADAPATREDVLMLFDTLRIREQLERVLVTVNSQMQKTMTDMMHRELPDATPQEIARFDRFMEDTQHEAMTVYPVSEMLEDMIPTYQKHLTHGDVEAVVAFYHSPVGQKLLSEQPAMTQEAMQVINAKMQPRMEKLMDRTTARARQMAEEMVKEKEKQQSQAPPAKK